MLKKLLVLFTALYATLAMAAVDANKASADELTSVKGIGPATATSSKHASKDSSGTGMTLLRASKVLRTHLQPNCLKPG